MQIDASTLAFHGLVSVKEIGPLSRTGVQVGKGSRTSGSSDERRSRPNGHVPIPYFLALVKECCGPTSITGSASFDDANNCVQCIV